MSLENLKGIILTTKDEISYLINKGGTLHTQANQALATGVHSNEASIIGDILVKEFIPHGYKRIVRKVGTIGQKTARANIKTQWHGIGKRFLSECESKVKLMSLNTKNLTISGNSHLLVQKFNRVRKIRNPISFFDMTLAVLQELQYLDLSWNKDIAQELNNRKEIAVVEQKERAGLRSINRVITRIARTVDSFNKLSISDQLKHYPPVQKSILGALDRLQTNAPDAERHCITSCRAAIESLCIGVGKEKDWKNSLNNIFSSDTDRKQVKGVWNYLSGKGVHGGHNPTKKEAEYCLQSTIATLNFIINRGKT